MLGFKVQSYSVKVDKLTEIKDKKQYAPDHSTKGQKAIQQELSEGKVVCQQQPNLKSICQLVCLKRFKFLSTDDNNNTRAMTIVL